MTSSQFTSPEFPMSLDDNRVLIELSELPANLGLKETDNMKSLSQKYISIVKNTEELTPEITSQAVDIMDQYEAAVKRQMAESPGNVLLPIAWLLKRAEMIYLGDDDGESYKTDLEEVIAELQKIKANPDFVGNELHLAQAALIEECIQKAQQYLEELD